MGAWSPTTSSISWRRRSASSSPGNEFPVNDIAGVRYGVAICKDMHFASLGRGFGAAAARA